MKTATIALKDLKLDLTNSRTMPQPDESAAIRAMAAISPNRFWGLMKDLLTNGYVPVEMIVVLERAPGDYIVFEGNRRVGALKLAHGLVTKPVFVTAPTLEYAKLATPGWMQRTSELPCLVFPSSKADDAYAIVARTHAHGQDASRDEWESLAKARFARDHQSKTNHVLQMFESFLKTNSSLSGLEKESWAGNYRFSLLDEAMGKAAAVLSYTSGSALAYEYLQGRRVVPLDCLMLLIGRDYAFTFEVMRGDVGGWTVRCGISVSVPVAAPASGKNAAAAPKKTPVSAKKVTQAKPAPSTPPANDWRSVRASLKALSITHPARAKISQLREEIAALDGESCVLVFCAAMRSLLEMSVRAYAQLHGIPAQDAGGTDKKFRVLLDDVVKHYNALATTDKTSATQLKSAQGEFTDPKKPLSWQWLSDMNHNHVAYAGPADILTQFHKVLPILQKLNA